MRPTTSLGQAVPVRGVLATAVTSHAAIETRSRAGTSWEGTVEEASAVVLLHGSRRS